MSRIPITELISLLQSSLLLMWIIFLLTRLWSSVMRIKLAAMNWLFPRAASLLYGLTQNEKIGWGLYFHFSCKSSWLEVRIVHIWDSCHSFTSLFPIVTWAPILITKKLPTDCEKFIIDIASKKVTWIVSPIHLFCCYLVYDCLVNILIY